MMGPRAPEGLKGKTREKGGKLGKARLERGRGRRDWNRDSTTSHVYEISIGEIE